VRLVLYTGKGGVGKTTTAAAAAVCAAERGRRTLVASADAAHSLGDVLERRLGSEPIALAPRLAAVEIDARAETARHWGRIQEYLVSMFLHQGIEGVVAEELALLPGAEEIVTLLAIEQYVDSGEYDLVIVDCAPTDAALRLATLPEVARGMLRVVLPALGALSGIAVPIARRLVSVPLPDAGVFEDVEELVYRRFAALQRRLTEPSTSVRLVLTPERMVIDEARRALTELSLFEVHCDAVVMNRLLPAEAEEIEFFRSWRRREAERLREVEDLFAPLPVLTAPLQDDEVTGLARLAQLGAALFAEREPDAVLCSGARVRFERETAGGYRALVPLARAGRDALDVVKVDDDLVITAGSRRRAIRLPRRVAPLSLCEARVEGDALVVRFARRAADVASEAGR
jgi:arsenite-transporting ATPase